MGATIPAILPWPPWVLMAARIGACSDQSIPERLIKMIVPAPGRRTNRRHGAPDGAKRCS